MLADVKCQGRGGETFFIVGGSECGTVTLLRGLLGLKRFGKGSVRLFGRPWSDIGPATRRQQLRGMGVLSQSGALRGNLT